MIDLKLLYLEIISLPSVSSTTDNNTVSVTPSSSPTG